MFFEEQTVNVSLDYTVKFRPLTIDEIYGQDIAKQIIKQAILNDTVAQAYLFYGDSGTGKTTLARLLALGVNCLSSEKPTIEPCLRCSSCRAIFNQSTSEYLEINVGDKTGVDGARELTSQLVYSTWHLRRRIVVLDECQQMTAQAQNLLLKPIEDADSNTHFILCTTDPRRIIVALRNRCKPVEFKRVSKNDLVKLLEYICTLEGIEFKIENLRLIANEAASPREAVSSLQQIVTSGMLDNSEWIRGYLNQITEKDEKKINELAQAIKFGSWNRVLEVLNPILEDYGEEQIRIALSAYFSKCLLNSKIQKDAVLFAKLLKRFVEPAYHKPELIYNIFSATMEGAKKDAV